MFDKITIRTRISGEECVHLAQLHRLQVWTNENGTAVDYRSSEYSKLTGIDVKIQRNVCTIKTSLHKYWNMRNYGRLRNDNVFTVSEARAAIEMLLFENGLTATRARVIQFEIGINMNVTYNPLSYIELVRYIGVRNKLMFVDANFRINRQKTTEKHRDIRKYYKIYDKGWEMEEKHRGKRQEVSGKQQEERPNILRVETVYRRHNERADKFFTNENIQRLVKRFYVDWKDLFFLRSVRAYKGARKSEVERAMEIVNNGVEWYMEQARTGLETGTVTEKQYRTMREFARDFEENGTRYRTIISRQEKEYNDLIYKVFDASRK